ncbi:MAG: GntR family transcriptional regulator [Lachnospiraceae bacterium]|nr:GntR family transcriptional regulator [Lachnospiraceae bacterium]MBR4993232.1 GntR family transcriptional regulator [Lachnospiraceae bacterium]MBR5944002.1 GntR family transcriptional regulator [Lachnospiraceae bacterium]
MYISDRLPKESARDFAFRTLRDNIVSLELKPGTLISENEIAMELGVSRTPVREAIIDLAKAGIIEILPQRGSYVSLIDPNMVEESRFVRKTLDKAVIELACEIAPMEVIEELEENVHLQEFYLEKADADKIYALDNQFHKLIYLAAGKATTYDMSSTMMLHFDRVRTLSVETVKDLKIVKDHREMLEAIKAGDKEAAVALVEKHLNRYRVDEHQMREEHPEYFM